MTTEPDEMAVWPTGRLLSMASRLVEHTWIERLDALGLTHAGLIALDFLQTDSLSQRELAGRARVQEQTMSRTIERLEREGLVTREADPADGRKRTVATTPEGTRRWTAARTIEDDLFPKAADDSALRSELLALIATLSTDRWPGA